MGPQTTKMSSRGQIVIPQAIRKALELHVGTEFLISLEGNRLILEPVKSFTDALRGLGKEVWQDVDATAYVNTEREAWEDQ